MDSIVEFYSRIYWENKSDSLKTPLGKNNLNKMDSAIKILDTRTVALYAEAVRLDEVKADKTQLDGMIVKWEFDQTTGIIKITRYDGAVSAINTTLNKLAVNFIYDAIGEKLIITQTDGTEVEVDMSALITQYEFLDTDTVSFSVDTNGKVSAIIKEGSIGEKHLNPDYLAEIKIEIAKAQGYATNAQESASNAAYEAKLAQSYSVGGSGVRDEEDSDNSKYYYELTKNIVSNANTIESSKITYQISPNGTEVPSGAWQTEIPEIQQGMFLWTKVVINYSNGSNSTFYSVAYSGIDGTGGSAGGIVKNEAYLADSQERILLTSSGQKILLPEYSQDIIPNSAKVLQNYFDDTAVTEINTFEGSDIAEKSVIFSLVDSTIIPDIDGMLTFFWKKELFNTLQMGFIMNKASHLKIRGRGNEGILDWEDWKTILDSENYSDYTIFQKTGVDNEYVNRTDLKPQLINVEEDTLIDGFLRYWTILNIGAYEHPNVTPSSFRTQLLFPYQNQIEDTEMFIRTAATRDDGTPYWRASRRVLHDGNYAPYIFEADINGYCSIRMPDNGQSGWLRTPRYGLLPYEGGSIDTAHGNLGTEGWYFRESYINRMYGRTLELDSNAIVNSVYIKKDSGCCISTRDISGGGGIAYEIILQPGERNVPNNGMILGGNYIYPLQDDVAYLGNGNHRWNQIYAVNGSISTSDRNQKKDISYIGEDSEYKNTNMSDELLIQFIRSLKPCVYLRRDGESGRPHHGFISEDFKKTMDEVGIADHAAYIKSPKMETIEKEVEQEREVYDEVEKKTKIVKEKIKIQEEKVIDGKFNEGLRYEEIIPDVTRFCQILYQQNQEQQELINLQQEEINELKVRLEILEKIVVQA